MTRFGLLVAFGATAFVSAAQAADLATSEPYAETAPMVVDPTRVVCDQFGRCWREAQGRTVIIHRDSYNAMPPGRRIIERGYYDDDRIVDDIGIHRPGVSVDVGEGHRW